MGFFVDAGNEGSGFVSCFVVDGYESKLLTVLFCFNAKNLNAKMFGLAVGVFVMGIFLV